MELQKQSENVNRSYDKEGNAKERIDSIQYDILDSEGNTIGNANIGNGYANASINISGFSTIAEGEERMKALFGQPGA